MTAKRLAPSARRVPLVTTLFAIVLTVMPTVLRADDATYRAALAVAIRNAANRALPSVVTVEIIGAAGTGSGEVERDAPTSGIVIDDDGYILASSIVVKRPSASILVVLPDGTRQAAKVVSRDNHRDLVLLKIETEKELQPIEWSNEVDPRVGETTIAVGRYGSDASPIVSSGVLSASGRLDGIALQTDARVSPAFYGGPLLDLRGNVLGVLIPAVAEGGAPDDTSWYDSGIAFAIPSPVIRRKLDRLRAGEDINKGLIGIVSKSKDPYENVTTIAAVRARSPAENAGIKAGDSVLEIEGEPVRRHQEIRQVLGSYDAGEKIRVKVRRGDEELEFDVTLAETIPPLQPQQIGVVLGSLESTEEDEASAIVVEAIVPDSPAEKELKVGDVIQKIGETEVKDVDSIRSLLISAEPEKPLALTLVRDDEQQKIDLLPTDVAGKPAASFPSNWTEPESDPWPIEKLKLPDVSNEAAIAAPKDGEDDRRLGLLVLLLNPGEKPPAEVLQGWAGVAQQTGVVVCAVAPSNESRWQPNEMEVISRFAAAVLKKAPIEESAVAVASQAVSSGGKAAAADSMALAVAVSQSSTFFGVSVAVGARPPAVRVRENEAESALELLLPIGTDDDLPAWTAPLTAGGYPILRGGELTNRSLLRWVRLLQAI